MTVDGIEQGYVTGAYAVARWLASQANEARANRRLDAETCRKLAAGAEAMVVAMIGRLNANPDGCDAVDWPAGDAKIRELSITPWDIRAAATGGGPCTCGKPFWTHVCLSCSPDYQTPGPGCGNCRNTGMDQTPCRPSRGVAP
ncbi:hypothetical protein Drose_05780 [Dactylosporangium roseum]|uniref:Uncharacterized protein n=1 Tax=Dactylosporangium roseum TaxID=47989 RepID=A0ABY5Z6V2_9ACTN|nr:hypothetical protein [Dactylosporangium roseum]UWZ37780.1 hypothetical protein Drose_05780 [Dactylosporangium roseum]